MIEQVRKESKVWRVVRWSARQTVRILAVVGAAALIYWTCFHCSCIVSDSMSPTLEGTDINNGDRVLTEKVSYWFRNPRRWEVVTIRRPDGVIIMKRVVGLPGERVQMLRDGTIMIDGSEVKPPGNLKFLKYFPYGNLISKKSVDCGDGFYVLGDKTQDSDDSRFNGPISSADIIGRAWLILWPSERRGFVKQ